MSFFADSEEVYAYIGEGIRLALEHPLAGPRLRQANLVVQLVLTAPAALFVIRMTEPAGVDAGREDPAADVRVEMCADIADRFWRGDYNLAVGLTRRKLRATGEVARFLRCCADLRPAFPAYRGLVSAKGRPI